MSYLIDDIPTQHQYSRGADIFAMAAEQFGVEVTDPQRDEWRTLLSAAFVLDHILDSDEPQTTREDLYGQYVTAIIAPTPAFCDLQDEHRSLFATLHKLVEKWTPHKTERLLTVTDRVRDIASTRRELRSATQLGLLALHEGTETARLFEIDTPRTNGAEDFNSWLHQLLRAGVVADTAVDLSSDYANGLTKVQPTKINRLIISAIGVPSVSTLMLKTPLRLYRPLISAVRAVTDDTDKDTNTRYRKAGENA